MTPSGYGAERLVEELRYGLLPYCQAVQDYALLWLAALLLLAGLVWWAQRTVDRPKTGASLRSG